jgi:hypothetical protein
MIYELETPEYWENIDLISNRRVHFVACHRPIIQILGDINYFHAARWTPETGWDDPEFGWTDPEDYE